LSFPDDLGLERRVDIAGHVNLDRADLGQHRLGPDPVAGIAMVTASGMVLVIAEMVAHLRLERGLEHLLGQLVQQPAGADKLDPLLPRLRQELLGKLLLIHSRHSCRRSFVFCCGCCHVTDRVSHGLSPFGFQTSQFNRSADSPQAAG
jgi:hypothetical protein